MSYRKLLSRDPLTGTQQWFEYDELTGQTRLITEYDIAPAAELAAEQRKDFRGRGGGKWTGDLSHVARLPMMVLLDLKKRGILGDQPAMKKWLNSSEATIYRSRPGRV